MSFFGFDTNLPKQGSQGQGFFNQQDAFAGLSSNAPADDNM